MRTRLEWFVINGNFNSKKTEMFNIFDNCHVEEECIKEVKKYLRAPSKYKSTRRNSDLTGFDAFVQEIDLIIKWQEWCRCEYEFVAYETFNPENEKRWDCYEQCHPNMREIAYTIIRQYKEMKKA